MFHDRHARLFWHDKAPDTSQLNEEFHETLKRILTQRRPALEKQPGSRYATVSRTSCA